MNILENFKDWYSELYGTKCPKGKDLYDFLNKKIGKPFKNSYKGIDKFISLKKEIDPLNKISSIQSKRLGIF